MSAMSLAYIWFGNNRSNSAARDFSEATTQPKFGHLAVTYWSSPPFHPDPKFIITTKLDFGC